jgi:hypothetical protein
MRKDGKDYVAMHMYWHKQKKKIFQYPFRLVKLFLLKTGSGNSDAQPKICISGCA